MRYVGQEHAVTVDLPMAAFEAKDRDRIKRHFDELHEVRYGTSAPNEPAELVSLRSTVLGVLKKPPLSELPRGSAAPPEEASVASRQVYFAEAGGFVETPVFRRPALLAGNVVEGPALIEEHASTTVLLPGDRMEVDRLGNLVITRVGVSK